uniref:BAR domain-containing protein n=1 Tax=Globodera pallida TaxID=36090 RepID=A0A183BIT4_GLOPA
MFGSNSDNWTSKKRLFALESKVSGKAERALESAKATQPFRYENIRREMIRQLVETDSRQLNAFDDLMTGVQRKSNENIDDLAGRISSLVQSAYPGLTNNLCDEYAINSNKTEVIENVTTVANRVTCLAIAHGRDLLGQATKARLTIRGTSQQQVLTERKFLTQLQTEI